MPSSIGIAVVFSTDKPQPHVREQRDKSGKIQGHNQQCNRVNVLGVISRVVTIFLWKLKEEMQGWGVGSDGLARLSAARGGEGQGVNGGRSLQPCQWVMAPFLNETVSPCLPESTLCIRFLLLMSVVSNLFRHRPLSAPEGPAADPGRRQGYQEVCFGRSLREMRSESLSKHNVPNSWMRVNAGNMRWNRPQRGVGLNMNTTQEHCSWESTRGRETLWSGLNEQTR